MSACGRKQTLVLLDFYWPERPLSSKADVQGSSWDHRLTIGWGTSALPLEADIGLRLV